MSDFKAVDIETLDRPALEARYRALLSWLIACLRGNNNALDEDALLHALWPESSMYYDRGHRGPDVRIATGGPCTIATDVVQWLDEVKAGKMTVQDCVNSMEYMAENNGWRKRDEPA